MSNKDRRRMYVGSSGKDTLFAMTYNYLYRLDGNSWNRIDRAPDTEYGIYKGHLFQSSEMIDSNIAYLTWESGAGNYEYYSRTRKYNTNDLLNAPVITSSSSLSSALLSPYNSNTNSYNPWVNGVNYSGINMTLTSRFNINSDVEKYIGGLSTRLDDRWSYWSTIISLDRSGYSYPIWGGNESNGTTYLAVIGTELYLIGIGIFQNTEDGYGSYDYKLLVQSWQITNETVTKKDKYEIHLGSVDIYGEYPYRMYGDIIPLVCKGSDFYFLHNRDWEFYNGYYEKTDEYAYKLSLTSKTLTKITSWNRNNIDNSLINIDGDIFRLDYSNDENSICLYRFNVDNGNSTLINSFNRSELGSIHELTWYNNIGWLASCVTRTNNGNYYFVYKVAEMNTSLQSIPKVYQITKDNGFVEVGKFSSSDIADIQFNHVCEVFTLGTH